ncbi:hypothetical protein WDU94_004404 [Cyamophila willieti]
MSFDCGIQMIPDGRVFNQQDPPEMMPNHCPSNLSPEQQARLDAFKFETIRSDYQYLRDHPEIHDILGYILQSAFLDQPVQIKKYLVNLFQQPDIKQKLQNFRHNKTSCYGPKKIDVEIVRDLGYQVVEGLIAEPCGTPRNDRTICDDRALSPHVMKRLRDRYDQRGMMLPDDGGVLATCPDYTDRTKTIHSKLTGVPYDSTPYGGDYIFLRNTRCGRAITSLIGDTNEIPTRSWPSEHPYMTPALSYDHLAEEALRELSGEKGSEEGAVEEEMGEQETQQDRISVPSGLELRDYYRTFGKMTID